MAETFLARARPRPTFTVFVLLLLQAFLWAQPSLKDLQDSLPDHRALVARDQELWLAPKGMETSYRIVAVSPLGQPLLAVGERRILFDTSCLEAGLFEGLAVLPELVARLDPEAKAPLLSHDPLFGPHLVLEEGLVTRSGLLGKAATADGAALPRLDPLVDALLAREELAAWPSISREALERSLRQLDQFFADDELANPDVIRRVVAFGGLRRHLDASPELLALEVWAKRAITPQDSKAWSGEHGERIARLVGAFGVEGASWRIGSHGGYRRSLPEAQSIEGLMGLEVVVFQEDGQTVRAEVWSGKSRLLRWSAGDALTVDQEAWDRCRPHSPEVQSEALLPNAWPPHLRLMDLEGRVAALITAHGRLEAPGSGVELDAFLSQAAKVLPDAAHLDLLGQILFQYCYDSPDPERPFLIGQQGVAGEVHQTVAETFSTAAGGVMHGDCDDLAELIEAVAARGPAPGRIMDLGDHAAFGRLRQEGKEWVAEVLQTGEPLAFRAKSAPEALRLAYAHLSPAKPFDPDQVPIAVRFEGENTRSVWFLSYRVYLSPEYAKVMIDVQRDWHRHTYTQAVRKMEALVASGDRDPANLREIAGLHSARGDFDQAAHWRRLAVDAGEDPTLGVRTMLFWELCRAGRRDEAQELGQKLVKKALPKLKKSAGQAYWTTLTWIARTLIDEEQDVEAALDLLRLTAHEMKRRQFDLIVWLESGERFDQEEWRFDEKRRLEAIFQEQAAEAIGFAIRRLMPNADEQRRETLMELAKPLEVWMRKIAFRDGFEDSTLLWRAATVGANARSWLGAPFFSLVEASKPAKALPERTDWRGEGLAQLRSDLPLIRAATPFWYLELIDLYDERFPTLDRELALRLARAARESEPHTKALGVQAVWLEAEIRACRLLEALILEDEKVVEEIFAEVGRLNDKGTRDDIDTTLMLAVRFLSLPFWERVVGLWSRHIDHRPTYFALAWGAIVNHAPRHAVIAAERAVKRFPDDQDFALERDAVVEAAARKKR